MGSCAKHARRTLLAFPLTERHRSASCRRIKGATLVRLASGLTHLVLWSLYAGSPKGGTRSMHREQLVGTYALLRRLLREYGRGYLPSYGAAFFFMALVAASTSLTAWI